LVNSLHGIYQQSKILAKPVFSRILLRKCACIHAIEFCHNNPIDLSSYDILKTPGNIATIFVKKRMHLHNSKAGLFGDAA
jgi:hypothetical protein